MKAIADRLGELKALADKQLFFIGGAPRSGTTWLQELLDAHPDVSCQGEALFMQQMATPIDAMVAARADVIRGKNERIFRHRSGYPLPTDEDADTLLGTGILLALERQCAGTSFKAIGEKTPENVFLFPRLKRIFPKAKFIAIARDPRDVLTSAWHFFQADKGDDPAAKVAFLKLAFPSLKEGAKAMIDFAQKNREDAIIVTYEALKSNTAPAAARLYRMLGVSDEEPVVSACVARTSFEAMTREGSSGGANKDGAKNGSFFRKGVVGDWTSTLTPDMNKMILDELGWMYPSFGWRP